MLFVIKYMAGSGPTIGIRFSHKSTHKQRFGGVRFSVGVPRGQNLCLSSPGLKMAAEASSTTSPQGRQSGVLLTPVCFHWLMLVRGLPAES